ncbi:DUF2911 domain-containing protein [Belliella marina]|uniref:DUF2911 domain-containing protein n=1 Tax=Belliella marina TaxID=1644146 RepID=A0ABW4VVR6_9BACT
MNFKQALILAMVVFSCSAPKEEGKAVVNEHEQHDHSAHSDTSNSKSPRTASMANIGSNHVHIDYSAPSVRGRHIFGGLVALDEVWVTGAHSATTISFSEDIMIDGNIIAKGKYALFTIPKEKSWTVILNSNFAQHLADDYDQSEDVLRVEVENIESIEPVEQLRFDVTSAGNENGELAFYWSNRGFLLSLSKGTI